MDDQQPVNGDALSQAPQGGLPSTQQPTSSSPPVDITPPASELPSEPGTAVEPANTPDPMMPPTTPSPEPMIPPEQPTPVEPPSPLNEPMPGSDTTSATQTGPTSSFNPLMPDGPTEHLAPTEPGKAEVPPTGESNATDPVPTTPSLPDAAPMMPGPGNPPAPPESPSMPPVTPPTGPSGEQKSQPEPSLKPKKKKRIMPVVLGVLALFLVAGVAGAAYYISTQLAQRQAVAPNAPTVNPLASSCSSTERDAPASNSITFSKSGTVILFTRNLSGTMTLSGPKTVTINGTPGSAIQNPTTFTVNAGETYSIKVRLSNESKDAAGWIPNKAPTTCGPTKSSGCGADMDISALVNLANANSDTTGISASGKEANIQCWGDAIAGDSTQDYDYNDFTLIFGYQTQTRKDYCVTSTVNPSTLSSGQTVTFTGTSNTPVNNFHFVLYNMDDLYGPNNPKPFCVGTDAPSQSCPNGGHQLAFHDTSTSLRTKGTATATYDQIFNVIDKSTGQKVKKVQVNTYFNFTGGPASLSNPNCVKWITAGTSTTRPDYCVSSSVSPTSMGPGGSVTFKATSNTAVNNFNFAVYNSNNLYGPNNPKPLCVGSDAASQPCPNGGHQLSFRDSNTSLHTNGTAKATYDQIFNVVDKSTGQKATKVQVNTYFSLTGGPVSVPQPACVTFVKALAPTATATVTASPPPAPMCTALNVATLQGGLWTRIRNDQITSKVKVGDTIRLYATGNSSTKSIRVKVTAPDGTLPFGGTGWKLGTIDSTGAYLYYVPLKITQAGKYSWQAEASSTKL